MVVSFHSSDRLFIRIVGSVWRISLIRDGLGEIIIVIVGECMENLSNLSWLGISNYSDSWGVWKISLTRDGFEEIIIMIVGEVEGSATSIIVDL